MVFSSPIFLFLFLPLVFAVYFLAPKKLRNVVLLVFSLIFYSWGEGRLVILLLLSALTDFYCGRIIHYGYRKIGLTISLIFNLAILGYFKYLDFTFDNLSRIAHSFGFAQGTIPDVAGVALPIGISFFTFQTMSYTIDVYRGNVKADNNLLNFATYVCLFPQLVAGPIVRYSDISHQLNLRIISSDKFADGCERFIIGLAKKVLIANSFAAIADEIFKQNLQDLSTPYAWLGILAYTFQIYFDFSGYSDMAIGLGKMLGFDFPENFNYPYISKSIREFWRRWHISLSTWFRDYVYISLGGNRRGNVHTYINLLIVFFVTGLWHGASWNFVIWGLFHGFFMIIERMGFGKTLSKIPVILQRLYTLVIVIVGWVFFRAETLSEALIYVKTMFMYTSGNSALSSYLSFFHINLHTLLTVFFAVLFSTPFYPKAEKFFTRKKLSWFRPIALLLLFITTIIYLGAGTYNPFIYFKF
ncbi:MBOAT family O-acyltransferase [Owenweeksia hongkongensis]|uniref:MBOAT family O-acyltransferase n=1 Tax=Owenweeksia hongkongensis TaxID=253245 RepID=UPI003A8D5D5D